MGWRRTRELQKDFFRLLPEHFSVLFREEEGKEEEEGDNGSGA
jgi:hypothetical protein